MEYTILSRNKHVIYSYTSDTPVSTAELVIMALKEGIRMDNADIEKADFSNMELPAGSSFILARFLFCNFDGCRMVGCNFEMAHLYDCSFRGTRLHKCNFTGSTLAECSLHMTSILDCNMANTDFELCSYPLSGMAIRFNSDRDLRVELAYILCSLIANTDNMESDEVKIYEDLLLYANTCHLKVDRLPSKVAMLQTNARMSRQKHIFDDPLYVPPSDAEFNVVDLGDKEPDRII